MGYYSYGTYFCNSPPKSAGSYRRGGKSKQMRQRFGRKLKDMPLRPVIYLRALNVDNSTQPSEVIPRGISFIGTACTGLTRRRAETHQSISGIRKPFRPPTRTNLQHCLTRMIMTIPFFERHKTTMKLLSFAVLHVKIKSR